MLSNAGADLIASNYSVPSNIIRREQDIDNQAAKFYWGRIVGPLTKETLTLRIFNVYVPSLCTTFENVPCAYETIAENGIGSRPESPGVGAVCEIRLNHTGTNVVITSFRSAPVDAETILKSPNPNPNLTKDGLHCMPGVCHTDIARAIEPTAALTIYSQVGTGSTVKGLNTEKIQGSFTVNSLGTGGSIRVQPNQQTEIHGITGGVNLSPRQSTADSLKIEAQKAELTAKYTKQINSLTQIDFTEKYMRVL